MQYSWQRNVLEFFEAEGLSLDCFDYLQNSVMENEIERKAYFQSKCDVPLCSALYIINSIDNINFETIRSVESKRVLFLLKIPLNFYKHAKICVLSDFILLLKRGHLI